MTTVSIRLSEGLYAAIGELASKLAIDKSDVTTLLLYFGLNAVKREAVSEEAWALIWADAMESYASFVRALAKLPPGKRKPVESEFQQFMSKIGSLVAMPGGGAKDGAG
jgi:hypothetical protein